MADTPQIKSPSDFAQTPVGLQARWTVEIQAAKKELKKWQDQSRKLVERFLDKRAGNQEGATRINMFSANVQTQRAMLYGKIPRVTVTRRYEDPQDSVARAAAIILERLLNTDIEDGTDSYATAIAMALDDLLLVGLGTVRLRYEADFDDQDEVPAQVDEQGNELAPAFTPPPVKSYENVKVDYVHWDDELWSPARTYDEVRWIGFKALMTSDELEDRFGKELARTVPMMAKRVSGKANETLKNDPWARAAIWEIWSKEDEKVYWFAEGCEKILDEKDDPLGLEGFFPCPRPMVSNLTTDSFMPRPDFILAQDLYNELDYVSTRITLLERAVKVVGVYDKTADGVRRIMVEGFDNDLIAIDNWAMFAERGGLKGQIDWLPLDQVVAALDKLREYRLELTKIIYEITGMSDIMRGEQEKGETATTSALKAKFASIRMQARQDEFARFATDILKIKAEIVLSQYEDQKILVESNAGLTYDAQLSSQALQLLRSEAGKYRIEVKPENISMTDLAAMKAERMEFVQAFTMMLQAGAPILQSNPTAAPFMLELLKWAVAGFKGASTVEQVIDQQISATQKALANPQPQQPNPQVQAQQARAQADIQVSTVKAQNEMQLMGQKQQIAEQRLQVDAAKAEMDMQKMVAKMRLDAQRMAMGLDNVNGGNAPQQ